MEAYDIVVAVHVISAILWVGGGITLLLGAELARRRSGAAGALPVIDVVALMGPVYFVPVSLLALVSGIAAAWIGPGFSELWIVLGLAGFAATFATGFLVIKPRAEEIAALMASPETDQGTLAGKSFDLVTIARFDYVVLILVVLAMVLKPSVTDVALLAVFAVIAVVGGILTLMKGMRAGRGLGARRAASVR